MARKINCCTVSAEMLLLTGVMLDSLFPVYGMVKCVNNSSPFAIDKAEDAYCIYEHNYDKHDCKQSENYTRVLQVKNVELENECVPLEESRSMRIMCICSEDYCNEKKRIMAMLTTTNELKKFEVDRYSISSNPESETAIDLFLCMKRQLGLPAVREGNRVVVVTPTRWYVLLSVVVIFLVVILVMLIAIPFIRKWEKKRRKKAERNRRRMIEFKKVEKQFEEVKITKNAVHLGFDPPLAKQDLHPSAIGELVPK